MRYYRLEYRVTSPGRTQRVREDFRAPTDAAAVTKASDILLDDGRAYTNEFLFKLSDAEIPLV